MVSDFDSEGLRLLRLLGAMKRLGRTIFSSDDEVWRETTIDVLSTNGFRDTYGPSIVNSFPGTKCPRCGGTTTAEDLMTPVQNDVFPGGWVHSSCVIAAQV